MMVSFFFSCHRSGVTDCTRDYSSTHVFICFPQLSLYYQGRPSHCRGHSFSYTKAVFYQVVVIQVILLRRLYNESFPAHIVWPQLRKTSVFELPFIVQSCEQAKAVKHTSGIFLE
ncbi:hypothetical protein TGRUB_432170 [Toxoplasma gondii RUB]|uniref:Uncharacterized protein n=1 Tax=Toxoplasma gondii RUB TaxID=935652 RepID=A0A086LTL0_TOXGO|nr:hypothetical protein TGRUB_432170 [Toxoplasma gondii RUB]